LYTERAAVANLGSMHPGAHRMNTVALPGMTYAVVAIRGCPLAKSCLHLRHLARPVGARPIRWVLGRALKPIESAAELI
jgi:hypothetical protein